jgi:hypothetical protein
MIVLVPTKSPTLCAIETHFVSIILIGWIDCLDIRGEHNNGKPKWITR